MRRRLFYILRVLKHFIAIQPDLLWCAQMGLMYCNVLAFIFNKPLPERPLPNWTRHASQLKSMASRTPENFFILADTSIIHSSSSKTNAHWLLSAGRIRLSRLLWLLRQVFRFDFYHKFSAKVSEYFTRPTTGGRNFVFNPGWLDWNLPSIQQKNKFR